MAVEIRIYEAPEADAPAFRCVGLAMAATSVELVERHYTAGHFTVEIPWEARHAGKLRAGRLVRIGEFWGIIDELSLSASGSGNLLSVTGRELKGLTQDRITIPPAFTAVTGAQGYDPANGPTETVMKHFVAANLLNPAQPSRVLYGLELAPDLGRGTPDDRYLSRHEMLSDVLCALGEASGLGYSITPDLTRHKFVFDVTEGADHTAQQSERKRVILDVRRKTALSQQYRYAAGDSRNLFYTTLAGSEFADEALTVTYVREGEEEPAGIRRRETHLSISADTPIAGEEYNELRRLALLDAERYRAAESFTVELAPGPNVYRRDYKGGDLVTVQNQDWGVTMDARLTEMQTNCSAGGVTYSATFGTAPLNVVGRLRRMIGKGG